MKGAVGRSIRGDGGALIFVFRNVRGLIAVPIPTSRCWNGVVAQLLPDLQSSPQLAAAVSNMNRCREPSPILLRPGRNIAAPAAVLCPHDDSLPEFSIVTDTTSIKNAIANAAPGVEVLEPGYLAGTEIFVQRVVTRAPRCASSRV